MLKYILDQFPKDPKDRETNIKDGLGKVCLISHNCHAKQANDGLSGGAIIKALPDYPSIIRPEGESQLCIKTLNVDYAIYLDALGNNNKLKCNQTFKGNTELDKAARYVFGKLYPFAHQGFRNDEMRLEYIGIPSLAVHRFPFPEYHTKDDTPAIMDILELDEAKKYVEEILMVMLGNFVPIMMKLEIPMLSEYGLWTDWGVNRPMKDVKEKILMLIDGHRSVLDITLVLDEGFWMVEQFINALVEAGLCEVN